MNGLYNRPEPQPDGCNYTIYLYRKDMNEIEVPNLPGWQIIWKGRRPGDEKEFYVLYKRSLNEINSSISSDYDIFDASNLLGACPRIANVARARLIESVFSNF